MTHYQERLWPSPALLVSLILLIPATLLVFVPIDMTVGIAAAALLYAGATGTLLLVSPRISVSDGELQAGQARLPAEAIGAVSSFEGAEATAQRGPLLDARAWLAIRGGISPVVRIDLNDESDPTPYWLVSTRRPRELREAIESIRPRTPGR